MSIHCIKSILDPPPSPVLLYLFIYSAPRRTPPCYFNPKTFSLRLNNFSPLHTSIAKVTWTNKVKPRILKIFKWFLRLATKPKAEKGATVNLLG